MARFLAQFYPNAWRERYGPEFEALLDDIHPRWTDLFDLLRGGLAMRLTHSNLTLVGILALVGAIASLSIENAMPERWRSEAVIQVRSSDNRPLRDVVAELSRRAFTNTSLARVVTDNDLYPAKRARQPMEDVVETAKKNIQIRPVESDPNAFQVGFIYPDPKTAQRVTNRLLNLFVEENIRLAPGSFTSLRVNTPATLPNSPVRPNLLAVTISGIGGGAVLGILAAWIAGLRRKAIVG